MPTRKPNAALLKQEPTATHKALAEFIEKTTGHMVPTGDVALVQRAYPLFLKSPAVVKAREAEAAQKAKEAAAKAAEKEQALKDRLAKIEAQRQRVLKQLGIETDDEFADAAAVKSESDVPVPDGTVRLKIVAPAKTDEPEDTVDAVVVDDDAPVTVTLAEADDEWQETVTDNGDGDSEWEEF